MRSTFKVLFFLKRDKRKASGQIPVFCRITVDGQEARFGMKCDVNPKYWDVKSGKATGRTAESAGINTVIDSTKSAIFKIYREMLERDSYVTAEKIKNSFLGIEQKHQTLLELFDSHNRERKLLIGIKTTLSTYSKYCTARRCLAEFITFRFNLNDIPVKEVNRQFIGDFETFLLTRYSFSQNSAVTVLKKFRHIIEIALMKEWIFRNPFKGHKLSWQDVDRGFLTQSEIEKLINCRFDKKTHERTRDIFVFCIFTGLAYTDLKHLTADNIQSDINGAMWIKGRRKKTRTKYNIPLFNFTEAILHKYSGTAKNGMLLPVTSITNYNRLLKKIAIPCGINKRMSSHLARHTFATLTLTKGVSMESVSKMLGHTSIATTQICARITENKIGNEMNLFAGKMEKTDSKMQLLNVDDIQIDDVFQTYKPAAGKPSDTVWEMLTEKVWGKMTNVERQSFVSEIKNSVDKPETVSDFYVVLMDYFLENLNTQCPLGGNGWKNLSPQTQRRY